MRSLTKFTDWSLLGINDQSNRSVFAIRAVAQTEYKLRFTVLEIV